MLKLQLKLVASVPDWYDFDVDLRASYNNIILLLGECMALWGEPNEFSIQHHVYIFMQYVDS